MSRVAPENLIPLSGWHGPIFSRVAWKGAKMNRKILFAIIAGMTILALLQIGVKAYNDFMSGGVVWRVTLSCLFLGGWGVYFVMKVFSASPTASVPHQDGAIRDLVEVNPEIATLGRREHQKITILAVIAALQYDPLKIPDGGKARVKTACLTRPELFTDAAFDHAWKTASGDGLIRMENHEKFAQK